MQFVKSFTNLNPLIKYLQTNSALFPYQADNIIYYSSLSESGGVVFLIKDNLAFIDSINNFDIVRLGEYESLGYEVVVLYPKKDN